MATRPAHTPRRTGHPLRVFAVASAAWTVTWMALGSLSDWGAFWISWIVAGFLVPELYAVFVDPAWTLSRNVWALEHLDFGHPFDFAAWSPMHWMVAVVVWLLFLWLSLHIPFGLLR
jgi:hypothetical protein